MDKLNLTSLSFSEQFFIWATRISLSPQIRTEQAQNTLEAAFERLHVPDALRPFLDFVGSAAFAWHNAEREPDVHCTHCTSVGEDEWRLLQAAAALQRRDVNLATSWIRDGFSPAGRRVFVERGLDFAATLLRRGCVLAVVGSTLADACEQQFEPARMH